MEKQLTYESAYEELESIYGAINNEEVSIDELAKKVKRAAVLIALCQAKLKSTEDEISKNLTTMPGSNQKFPESARAMQGDPEDADLPF